MPLPRQGVAQGLEELGTLLASEIAHALRERLPVVASLTRSRHCCPEEYVASCRDDRSTFVIEFDLVTEDRLYPRRHIRRQNEISLHDLYESSQFFICDLLRLMSI